MKTLPLLLVAAFFLEGAAAHAQSTGQAQVQSTGQTPGNFTGTPRKIAGGGGTISSMLDQFEDASSAMGPEWTGPTFGAGAWGDFNGDGWPDLWQSNHAKHPTILQNNGDGTFIDVSATVVSIPDPQDAHGLAWADFDDDGDLDLIELIGAESGLGSGPNQLWLNDNGIFTEVSAAYGLDYPTGRGRTPLWLDWNNDGRLDLVTSNFSSAVSEDKLFTQQANGTFLEESASSGFVPSGMSSHYAQMADFDADGEMDVHVEGNIFPSSIFSFTSTTWTNITNTLGLSSIPDVVDSAPGDFDGDLIDDFYFARDPFWKVSQVGLDKNGALRADMLSDQSEVSFSFDCKGPILVSMEGNTELANIFLGSAGSNPINQLFVLSHKDSISGGLFDRSQNEPGVFFGRELDSNTWKVTLFSPGRVRFPVIIQSQEPITKIASTGFAELEPGSDIILDHSQTGWTAAGIWSDTFRGSSVVTGDFDNDMDLDLYVVRTGSAINLANKLFENDGQGQFTAVDAGGGAAGIITGVGDSVSMVDYDLDGFLDLFVTNGRSGTLLSQSGHHQLFHNTGNLNHWLEIDLKGTSSNVHGIGARILATSGGVTQLREQGGGIHRTTQNHSRIHFGFASNTMVDVLEIRWPNGTVQTLTDIPVDQILEIVEP